MGSGHHLSLSLTGEMWNEILGAALPFTVAGGEIDLASSARSVIRQLQVKERVNHLLEDRRTPQPLVRISNRARSMWSSRRQRLYQSLNDLVHVEGTWTVEVDEIGTNLRYGQQKVGADAFVKGVAEGQITFLRENITLPYRVEKRLGASIGLGRIRFSPGEDAVIGNVQDLAVHLGDGAVLQLLSRVIEYGIEQQLDSVKPVPVIKREQVEGLVGGMGGAMRMQMGIDDLQLDISDEEMTLKVRFGFTPMATDRQLSENE